MLLTPLAAAISSTARWMLCPMVGGASSRTTPSSGRQEGRLVGPVGNPVEVALDASDVVALFVEGGPERGPRHRRVVREVLRLGTCTRECLGCRVGCAHGRSVRPEPRARIPECLSPPPECAVQACLKDERRGAGGSRAGRAPAGSPPRARGARPASPGRAQRQRRGPRAPRRAGRRQDGPAGVRGRGEPGVPRRPHDRRRGRDGAAVRGTSEPVLALPRNHTAPPAAPARRARRRVRTQRRPVAESLPRGAGGPWPVVGYR